MKGIDRHAATPNTAEVYEAAIACARWKVWAWEQDFAAYADAGLQRICADCGAPTSPRDPVFDLCRACERVYLGDR